MSQTKTYAAYAAIVIAVLALVLSIRASSHSASTTSAGSACVDEEARARVESLIRALAERDVTIARLAHAANTTASGSNATPTPPAGATTDDSSIRRFAHIETSNPAVTVTQKADGTFDIRTTDPALAGQVLVVTAVTATGQEEKMMVRVPAP